MSCSPRTRLWRLSLVLVAAGWSTVLASGPALAQIPEASAPTDAAAPTPSVEALATLAAELGSDDAATRRRAFETCSTLSEAWIGAVTDRATALARQHFEPDEAEEALRHFRHATGSRRADDAVDIADGVLDELDSTRDRVTVAMAERVALMRAMENLGGRRAGRALMDLFALNPDALTWERRRLLDRRGLALLPVLLDARSHPSPDIRRWARLAVPAIEGADAGRVVGALANRPGALADTLSAWAAARDFDAMPVVVTFVDAEDGRVREAARDAMRAYGQNGIWMLRRQFQSSLGEAAASDWGWHRTFDELMRRLDEQRLAPAREALQAGLAAAETGDLEEMRRDFQRSSLEAPLLAERTRMAPGYARWAEAEMDAGHYAEARAAFLHAARLTDDAVSVEDLRARALLAEAEAERQQGVVDLAAYRLVTQLSPGQTLAAQRVAEEQDSGGRELGPRELSMVVGACLGILGLLLIFGNELPAVALARKAALAGARMATSAGRTLRAHAQRSLGSLGRESGTVRLPGSSWAQSLPLALLRPKRAQVSKPPAGELGVLDLCSTQPGMDDSGDVHSTSPGLDISPELHRTGPVDECVDVYSTAPGIDAPWGEVPAPSTRGGSESSAIDVAEALGILQATPTPLDPFDDMDPFDDESFEGADALFD